MVDTTSFREVGRRPTYCPHCGMSRSYMRLVVSIAMGEGFVMGLAITLFFYVLVVSSQQVILP